MVVRQASNLTLHFSTLNPPLFTTGTVFNHVVQPYQAEITPLYFSRNVMTGMISSVWVALICLSVGSSLVYSPVAFGQEDSISVGLRYVPRHQGVCDLIMAELQELGDYDLVERTLLEDLLWERDLVRGEDAVAPAPTLASARYLISVGHRGAVLCHDSERGLMVLVKTLPEAEPDPAAFAQAFARDLHASISRMEDSHITSRAKVCLAGVFSLTSRISRQDARKYFDSMQEAILLETELLCLNRVALQDAVFERLIDPQLALNAFWTASSLMSVSFDLDTQSEPAHIVATWSVQTDTLKPPRQFMQRFTEESINTSMSEMARRIAAFLSSVEIRSWNPEEESRRLVRLSREALDRRDSENASAYLNAAYAISPGDPILILHVESSRISHLVNTPGWAPLVESVNTWLRICDSLGDDLSRIDWASFSPMSTSPAFFRKMLLLYGQEHPSIQPVAAGLIARLDETISRFNPKEPADRMDRGYLQNSHPRGMIPHWMYLTIGNPKSEGMVSKFGDYVYGFTPLVRPSDLEPSPAWKSVLRLQGELQKHEIHMWHNISHHWDCMDWENVWYNPGHGPTTNTLIEISENIHKTSGSTLFHDTTLRRLRRLPEAPVSLPPDPVVPATAKPTTPASMRAFGTHGYASTEHQHFKGRGPDATRFFLIVPFHPEVSVNSAKPGVILAYAMDGDTLVALCFQNTPEGPKNFFMFVKDEGLVVTFRDVPAPAPVLTPQSAVLYRLACMNNHYAIVAPDRLVAYTKEDLGARVINLSDSYWLHAPAGDWLFLGRTSVFWRALGRSSPKEADYSKSVAVHLPSGKIQTLLNTRGGAENPLNSIPSLDPLGLYYLPQLQEVHLLLDSGRFSTLFDTKHNYSGVKYRLEASDDQPPGLWVQEPLKGGSWSMNNTRFVMEPRGQGVRARSPTWFATQGDIVPSLGGVWIEENGSTKAMIYNSEKPVVPPKGYGKVFHVHNHDHYRTHVGLPFVGQNFAKGHFTACPIWDYDASHDELYLANLDGVKSPRKWLLAFSPAGSRHFRYVHQNWVSRMRPAPGTKQLPWSGEPSPDRFFDIVLMSNHLLLFGTTLNWIESDGFSMASTCILALKRDHIREFFSGSPEK